MAAIMHVGPVIVDLDQVDGLGEHLGGVSDRLDGLGPPETLSQTDLGDGRVASALAELIDATATEHVRAQTELAALAHATRSAASGYRQVDDAFINELTAGGSA